MVAGWSPGRRQWNISELEAGLRLGIRGVHFHRNAYANLSHHRISSPSRDEFSSGRTVDDPPRSNMNTLQAQQCLGALQCQATAHTFLAPLVLSVTSVHIPRRNLSIQTRALHQHARQARARPLRQLAPIRPHLVAPQFSSPSESITAQPRTYATASGPQPTIHTVFEPRTGTFQYLVADPLTKTAIIIDPVLDYDKCAQTITTTTADALLSLIREKGYTISRILETHAHADHLTASFYLKRRLAEQQDSKPLVCIGARIGRVQSLFGQRYGIDAEEYEGVFDELLGDDVEFDIGKLKTKAIHLPGHTPDHMGYKIGGKLALPRGRSQD